jgi:hypothetical protein
MEHTNEITNNHDDNDRRDELMQEDEDGLTTIKLKGIPK